jgi:hypothetical protein
LLAHVFGPGCRAVQIGEPVLDPSFNVISGEVMAHSPSRDEIYHQLAQVPAKRVSVEYAGAVPADLVVAL